MNRLGLIRTSCTTLDSLMLIACTQDEATDGNIQDLPEGKYPFVLTATQGEIVASPQTRVSDYYDQTENKLKSKWDGGEVITVQLTGEKASEVTAVKVKGYPSCTISEGTVTGTGIITYLPMIKKTYTDGDYWETNLAPQNNISKDDFLQINENITVGVVIDATELSAGNCYTFNVMVSSAGINLGNKDILSNISVKVAIKGNDTETANPIIITDNAVLPIENVNIKTTGENENAIIIKKDKKLELKVKGTGYKLIANSHTANQKIGKGDMLLNSESNSLTFLEASILAVKPQLFIIKETVGLAGVIENNLKVFLS